MLLEEELGLRKAEIQNLQARLGGADALEPPPTDAQAESVSPASREQMKESGELGEKYETAQREVESLKAMVDSKNQEISEMKQKIQRASKENIETMDTWKVSALLLPDFM